MLKYAIIANNYQKSTQLVNNINKLLQNYNFKENIVNPQYVFVIGGDGTLLQAVNKFQIIIDKVYFIMIKSGSLCFYANYDENTYTRVIDAIINNKINVQQMSLLEIKYNQNIIYYALNEAKVVDHVKTIRTDIYVNDDLLEYFRGSGIVFATKTGSTGYMRAINGSIIATNISKLWQLKEIAPVANSTFSTINASIILDQTQVIRLIGDLKGKSLVVDTYESEILSSEVELKISQKTLKLFYDKKNNLSIITKMKLLFANCNNNII